MAWVRTPQLSLGLAIRPQVELVGWPDVPFELAAEGSAALTADEHERPHSGTRWSQQWVPRGVEVGYGMTA